RRPGGEEAALLPDPAAAGRGDAGDPRDDRLEPDRVQHLAGDRLAHGGGPLRLPDGLVRTGQRHGAQGRHPRRLIPVGRAPPALRPGFGVGGTRGRPGRKDLVLVHFLRKIGFYLVALWAAVTLNFFIPRLLPGSPVDAVLAKLALRGPVSPHTREAIEV